MARRHRNKLPASCLSGTADKRPSPKIAAEDRWTRRYIAKNWDQRLRR